MGFVCFFTLLILLLMIIHIGIINEGADFQLLTIPGEKEDNGGQLEEPTPIFNPPLSDNPIFSLAAVASQNPPSPPNSSCTNALPPTLPASLCKDPAFTGQLLQTRRKIIHVVLFGFEVSLLKEPCLSRRRRRCIHQNRSVVLFKVNVRFDWFFVPGGHLGDPPEGDGGSCRSLLSSWGDPHA